MARHTQKFPKTLLGRTRDCEAHVKFLSEAIANGEQDVMYYKQIAGELRILVADHKPKNRLLLQLMKDLGVSLGLHPPSPPSGKWTVMKNAKETELWEGSLPLELYCERGLACVLNTRAYSIAEFIRNIAQQEGSSHESNHIDEMLSLSHSILIANVPSHIYTLFPIARTIKGAAVDFMRYVVEHRAYRARYNWGDNSGSTCTSKSPCG